MLRFGFLVVIVIAGCASHSQTTDTKNNETNLYNLLGGNYDSLPNASGKFTLFVQQFDLTARNPLLKAIVLETASKKILTSFSFTPGYSKWKSEDEVEVFNAPGIIRKDEDESKFIRILKIKTSTQLR